MRKLFGPQDSPGCKNAGIKPVAVTRQLFELVRWSKKVSRFTNGVFDISQVSLDKIWKFDGSMNCEWYGRGDFGHLWEIFWNQWQEIFRHHWSANGVSGDRNKKRDNCLPRCRVGGCIGHGGFYPGWKGGDCCLLVNEKDELRTSKKLKLNYSKNEDSERQQTIKIVGQTEVTKI